MTPPPASVQTQPLATHVQHPSDDSPRTLGSDRFAVRCWTSEASEGNSAWSAASYWVRRKRANDVTDLGA